MRLANKVAMVTGAKGGLGSFVTEALLSAGATVVGVSRSIKASDFAHAAFHAHAAELGSLDAARQAVSSIVAAQGRLDAVVHLVGGFEMGGYVEDTSGEAFAKMMELNLYSALRLFQAALPGMRAQGSGRLVAIGSRAALEPGANTSAYNVSKAALVSLVRTIAEETKTAGISANVVLPGTMDTAANRAAMPGADFARWVQPGQVAALIVHLLSDEAAQVTGAAIPIYGGS
ncbi:MAG: SDR family NAD(P)-dependent oxidoreductase [Bryobacterales bacterium]|nr:SDR family NAD(P)-dependent oxidoreductase [Bryobacterales bacterium]